MRVILICVDNNAFCFIYFVDKVGRYHMRKLGEILATTERESDLMTLSQAKFVPGDFLDIAIFYY